MKNLTTEAVDNKDFSLCFFATLFGNISPKKNTTIVVINVLAVTADIPNACTTAFVTIAAAAI